MSASTSRTVEGQQIIVGGVAVTVELSHGELDIRVSGRDREAEGEQVVIGGQWGKGHGTLYVDGDEPGAVSAHRFVIYDSRMEADRIARKARQSEEEARMSALYNR
jgi:hypothetical protein